VCWVCWWICTFYSSLRCYVCFRVLSSLLMAFVWIGLHISLACEENFCGETESSRILEHMTGNVAHKNRKAAPATVTSIPPRASWRRNARPADLSAWRWWLMPHFSKLTREAGNSTTDNVSIPHLRGANPRWQNVSHFTSNLHDQNIITCDKPLQNF
jgi:hypothetical protein